MIIQAAPKSVAGKAATWRGANNVRQVPGNRIGTLRKIPGNKLPPGAPKFPHRIGGVPRTGGGKVTLPGFPSKPMPPRGTNLGKITKGSGGSLINLSAAQKAKVKSAAQAKIAGR